jgi:Flp pilus assembly pilin Flp
MKKQTWWLKFWDNQNGQDLIEYALLVGLLALGAIAVLPNMISGVAVVYSKVNSALQIWAR